MEIKVVRGVKARKPEDRQDIAAAVMHQDTPSLDLAGGISDTGIRAGLQPLSLKMTMSGNLCCRN